MERLFTLIGKLNNILLLCILIGAAASIAWVIFESKRWQPRGAVEVAESGTGPHNPILLRFEKIENISGARTQMMRLTTQDKSGKFSSGGYGSEIRNILFLSGEDKATQWLFKDHKNLIIGVAKLQEDSHQENSDNSKQQPTRALYFEFVTEDTNKDGVLSSEDNSRIGISKPDGSNFVVILSNLSRVLAYEMSDKENLSVVYQQDRSVKHARISLVTMKIVSDHEIVKVPSTL